MDNIEVINNFKTLNINRNHILWYKSGKLYLSSTIRENPVLLGELSLTGKQRILSKFRLTERMLRLEPRAVASIDENEYIISSSGFVYRANIKTGEIIKEHSFRKGMNNAMNFCKIEGIEGFDDCIVYGEYWGNTEYEGVSIYARKNEEWSKIFTFSEGRILHIHGIIADPFRGGILILTGDSDDESGIWIAKDNFRIVEPLLAGRQDYRACVAFPVKDGILYATDSPLIDNFIALATEGANGWEKKVLCEMPGPCIYAAKLNDKYIFSTSVEPDSSIRGFKYMITYSLGKGVKDRYTHIIAGNQNSGFKDIIKLKKDVYPMLLFQFGSVQFPGCSVDEFIVMNPVSVKNYDGKTVLLNVN